VGTDDERDVRGSSRAEPDVDRRVSVCSIGTMATGADLDESLDPSRTSMEAPWSGLGSVSDETIAGSLDGAEHSRVSEGMGLSRGATVGRYVILGRLGTGAMGVVFTAHDPELDRIVALKLLRPRGNAQRMVTGHRRLLAEAQALARLSHPHVVVVHDVGEHEGLVFVAMEFVEGRTLAAWLEQGSHPWTEVLEVMTQAGRGLAAAHARDLVHRDFKPDNVMLGNDGRVRVMDFGLVRAADGTSTEDSVHDVSRPRMPALSLMLTVGEGMVGTPAYASPEQLAGGRGGAAGDQFSFCVTLWEALHGRRPFVAETLPELAAKILGGEIAEPPPEARVPSWLRRIVERGLAVDPAMRWASMDALLAALVRGRARARARRGLAAVGLVAAIAAGAAGWRWQGEQRRIRACEAEGAAIAEVWNEQIAAELRTAMIATGVGHAEVTAGKLTPWLDAHASVWKSARTEACLRAEVEESWDAETIDRARWCLDERRTELEVLVRELREGDASNVANAVPAAARLERLDPCTDELTLSRLPVPPAEDREVIAQVRDELLRADALHVQADAAKELAFVVGDLLARPAEGLRWAYHQELVIAHWSDPTGLAEAEQLETLAIVRHAMGEYEAAKALYERVRSLREQALGADHLDVGFTIGSLAILLQDIGDHAQAKGLNERALALAEHALGPNHPTVGNYLNNLARDLRALGDTAQAKQLYERALTIWEVSLGPEHPHVAQVLNNLGNVSADLGDLQQSKVLHERALVIRERVYGPDHPQVAASLENLANVEHASVGPSESALPRLERALAIREKALGPDHPTVAFTLNNLGAALTELGRPEEARERLERALRIWDASVAPEHPQRLATVTNLAVVALAQDRVSDASRWIEDALRIRSSHETPPVDLAITRFTAAKARWAAGEDRAQALALAEQARDVFREHDYWQISEVEEWIASHGIAATERMAKSPSR
jgi:tetratricopeptide (TPR) repeat protein